MRSSCSFVWYFRLLLHAWCGENFKVYDWYARCYRIRLSHDWIIAIPLILLKNTVSQTCGIQHNHRSDVRSFEHAFCFEEEWVVWVARYVRYNLHRCGVGHAESVHGPFATYGFVCENYSEANRGHLLCVFDWYLQHDREYTRSSGIIRKQYICWRHLRGP